MNKLKIIFPIILLVTVIAVILLWLMVGKNKPKEGVQFIQKAILPTAVPPSPPPEPGPPPPNSMKAILQTPFQFYGIVLDQDGKPVVGAKVDAAALNVFTEGGTPTAATSDAAGKFSIQSHGASLHVNVSKSGYYQVDPGGNLKPSSQGFDFVEGMGRGIHRSDPASPDVFHLRKAGNPVTLERIETSSKVPRDGRPVSVRLSKSSDVSLRIRCRTVEDGKTPTDPSEWRCEVDVVGGGIQDVTDETNFSAPQEGYTPLAVIDMPKSLGVKQWSRESTKRYWLHFPDNTFAKIEFRMIAAGDHFADIGGYRNPTANIRNLEPKLSNR